jgi:hypothetical protein
VNADIAALNGIADLRQRVAAAADAIEAARSRATDLRRLRDSLIYSGVDRYGIRSRCLVPDTDSPDGHCQLPHKGVGLCERHYMMWRAGKRWDKPQSEGGLGLAAAPRKLATVSWKKRALELSTLTNYQFQRATELRLYPTADGGWSHNRDDWTGVHGYWRRSKSPDVFAVHELPEPPVYATDREHWIAVRDAHRAVKDLTRLVEQLRTQVRDPALIELLPTDPSNIGLGKLAKVGEWPIYTLRRKLREGQIPA